MIRKLPFLLAALSLTLLLSVTAQAEQIKLSDGRFLQGEIGEIKADGFSFKLTETGGTVFLRWSQVDAALKKRLLNEKDPDEGLNLEVLIDGARIELVNGDVLMGNIVQQGGNYLVTNLELPRGKTIAAEDVMEGGFTPGVKIPATVLKTPDEVLRIAEEQRAPLEKARDYYELARIADRMALYEASKDYVTLALGASPDKKLQAKLEEYNLRLDELIRQRDLLNAMTEARKAANKHVYAVALSLLDEAKKKYNPTGEVLNKFEETRNEIDAEYTKFVISEWYKQMIAVAKKKGQTSTLTWQEGRNYALRELENDIKSAISLKTAGDVNDIKNRFAARDKTKLPMKRASFEETGFYDIVGGHLPSAGNVQQSNPGNPNNPNPNPDRPSGRPGSRGSIGPDKDSDGFQMEKKEPDNKIPNTDDLEDFLRKAKEAYDKAQAEKAKQNQNQDLSKLKVPENSPSIDNWWKAISRTARGNWMVAVYVKFGGTMTVLEQTYWDMKYK